jgi:hypothetical protein
LERKPPWLKIGAITLLSTIEWNMQMEPLKLSQAIEENTLELFAWICLFPITLVDLVLHPIIFLEKMALEKSKTEGPKFDNRMPPVLFFLLGTVPLSIAVNKTDKALETMPAIADASLVMAFVLCTLPFIWALATLAAAGRGFGRMAFREAFGAQCYLFCPIWLFLLMGVVAMQLEHVYFSNTCMSIWVVLVVWGVATEWRLLDKTASLGRRLFCFAAAVGVSVCAYAAIVEVAIATGQKWIA